MSVFTRLFRVLRLPTRRLTAANATTGAPLNLKVGEMAFDDTENKIYIGKQNGTVASFVAGSGVPAGVVISDATGITGATAITNIVSISQANYDALAVKSPTTVYIIS